jgi:FkbM family methyltransferase
MQTPGASEILRDHAGRTLTALQGFGVYGPSWLRPWLTYGAGPLASPFVRGKRIRFNDFNIRTDQCDLYTFANVFGDYPVAALRQALFDVEVVVDLGANVGGFSYLIWRLLRQLGLKREIIAVEPDPTNAAFLRSQPFASEIEIREAAVGSKEGTASLVPGCNSVTHSLDFSQSAKGVSVSVVGLSSLCRKPALVKMDVEGSEREVLRAGLPDTVRYLAMEWHGPGTPADCIAGNWQKLSRDLYGASMWWWSR